VTRVAPRSGAATVRRLPRVSDDGVPGINERELQAAVITLARSLGWGITQSAAKAIATEADQYGVTPPPLEGLIYHPRYSLGSEPGWPDLTLMRRRDRRLVFAELKTEKGRLSDRQLEVMALLGAIAGDDWMLELPMAERLEMRGIPDVPKIQTFVWRPSDLASGAIAEVLR